jgi:hypothetical protein
MINNRTVPLNLLITPEVKPKGKHSAGNPHAMFDVAGNGKVLWRAYTGTKLETVVTAKETPKVTRHSLTLLMRANWK